MDGTALDSTEDSWPLGTPELLPPSPENERERHVLPASLGEASKMAKLGGLKPSWAMVPSIASFSRISGILLTYPQPFIQSVAGPLITFPVALGLGEVGRQLWWMSDCQVESLWRRGLCQTKTRLYPPSPLWLLVKARLSYQSRKNDFFYGVQIFNQILGAHPKPKSYLGSLLQPPQLTPP